MAQNFSNNHGASHGSPPSQQANGYEDLMGSLKSPGLAGPAAPFQQPSFATTQWPMQLNWQQTASQGNFPYSMSSQMSPVNQMSWNQNGQEGYVPFAQEEEDDGLFTVDDTELMGQNGQQHSSPNLDMSAGQQISQAQQHKQPGQLPSLSSSSPLVLPPPQIRTGVTDGPAPVPASPKVNNAATTARAAELRAKLLANRGPKITSRQASPAVKSHDLSDIKKAQLLNVHKHTNGESESEINQQQASAAASAPTNADQKTDDKPGLQPPLTSPTNTTTSLNGAIDTLMADARDAVDAPKPGSALTNGKYTETSAGKPASVSTNDANQTEHPTSEPSRALSRNRSLSELSEPGEIRSGATTPTPAGTQELSRSIDSTKAVQEDKDQAEKLARQNEVQMAYQPLKKPKANKAEAKGPQAKALPPPKQTAGKIQQLDRKPSLDKKSGGYEQLPIREDSRREEHRERARVYDLREDFGDPRRTLVSEAYPTPYDLDRNDAARRQRMTEENARRAAEYKRNLDAQRARQSAQDNSKSSKQKHSHEVELIKQPQSAAADTGRKDSLMSNVPSNTEVQKQYSVDGRQDVDAVMPSPPVQPTESNEDINDWLELTNFYDQEYREERLELFRQKRALDIQREEIERKDQQLQERTLRTRAQSILTTSTPSPATRRASIANVRMPPPPIPLKQANNDAGIKIKSSALSAGLPASQPSSPTLKRQHAEDDTETSRLQSMDKRARLDTNNIPPDERPLISPASAKEDKAPARGEPLPLESRMSRYDDWPPPPPRGRPRSRSPDFRRRSLSPQRRRYSQDYSPGPPAGRFRDYSTGPRRPNDQRACFNCGQRGHYHGKCPEPRRDGRDSQAAPRRYEQYIPPPPNYVLPNYMGKTPQANPPPPKSRVNSVSKIEEV